MSCHHVPSFVRNRQKTQEPSLLGSNESAQSMKYVASIIVILFLALILILLVLFSKTLMSSSKTIYAKFHNNMKFTYMRM